MCFLCCRGGGPGCVRARVDSEHCIIGLGLSVVIIMVILTVSLGVAVNCGLRYRLLNSNATTVY